MWPPSNPSLDDAPLADPRSQELLGGLLRRPPNGVLVILAGRIEAWHRSPLGPDSRRVTGHVDRLELTPLSASDVEAMLESMAPFAPEALSALSSRLHGDAGGSPGQIEELVRLLADQGAIAPGPTGTWMLRDPIPAPLPLPRGAREIMEVRVGRLSETGRRLLEACAVLGPAIEPAVLEAMTGLAPAAFQDALGELLSLRFLRQNGARPGHYGFLSDTHRRAVSDLTAPSRRRTLHRQAAGALEQRGGADAGSRESIATHRALGGPSRPSARRGVAIGIAAAVVGLAAIAVFAARRSRAANVAPGTPILLADVNNSTGDSLLDRTVYTAALVSLQQSQRVWIFPRTRMPEVLARMGRPAKDAVVDEELGREIAQRENIGVMVQLAVATVEPALLLTARLMDVATGRDLRTFEVRGWAVETRC
jgi:hypothetical protein